MTLVASWMNLERLHAPELWTIADTKIITNETILTEEGAKLLELPIVCRNVSMPSQPIYYRSSIGFAYAGSSLVGFNVHAMLTSILSNLGSANNKLPDYVSIAEKTRVIAMKYSESIRDLTEICLHGFCPKSKQPFIVTIKGSKDPKLYYNITSTELRSDMACTYIGDSKGSERMAEIVEYRLSKLSDLKEYWRTPVYALKELIENREFTTIGGGVQLTITTLNRFEQTWVLTDTSNQKDSFSFRNLDLLNDIGVSLGDCLVAINGIAFNG